MTPLSFALPSPAGLRIAADIQGIGGRYKSEPSDFVVDEMPLYEPSGTGDHVYVRIEKSGISTFEAVRRIALDLEKRPDDVGTAGLKDAHGIARQWISIEHIDPARVEALSVARVAVLAVTRHGNKLKRGHLAGNRFTCVLRDVDPAGEDRARQIIGRLQSVGLPNGFGRQRFGMPPIGHITGKALVQNDPDGVAQNLLGPLPDDLAAEDRARVEPAELAARAAFAEGDVEAARQAWPNHRNQERGFLNAWEAKGAEVAVKRLPKKLKGLWIAAYQSAMFNHILAHRIAAGTLGTLTLGDVAIKHQSNGAFVVEDVAAEQARCDAFEISPSGPMYGTKSLLATGTPGARETELLAAEGVSLDDFGLPGGLAHKGERRPYRIPVGEIGLEWGSPEPGCCRLTFTLGPGHYATNVLDEIIGTAPAG